MKYKEEQLKKEYVIKQHLTYPDKGLCFFTSNTEKGGDCYGSNGVLWYQNVDFADTVEEAQALVRKHSTYPTMKELTDYYRNKKK